MFARGHRCIIAMGGDDQWDVPSRGKGQDVRPILQEMRVDQSRRGSRQDIADMAISAGKPIIDFFIFARLGAMQQMGSVTVNRVSVQYVLSYYDRIISIKTLYVI